MFIVSFTAYMHSFCLTGQFDSLFNSAYWCGKPWFYLFFL